VEGRDEGGIHDIVVETRFVPVGGREREREGRGRRKIGGR
jgi:hypothetical protein